MHRQLKLCAVGLKLLIAVLSPTIAGAETYYVANNGVDANIGSIERPFATVMRAQEVASPGDTVFMHGGTYLIAESQIAKQQLHRKSEKLGATRYAAAGSMPRDC